MRNLPAFKFLALVGILHSFAASAHPLSLGRMSIENAHNTVTLKLEIDQHSCDHILGSKCSASKELSKGLFEKSVGMAAVTYNNAPCVWNTDQVMKKVSSELIELTVSSKCSDLATGGELQLKLDFLKKLGSKYHLMAKTKLNGEERVVSASAKEPSLKLSVRKL
ncbi:MAG TPA: hypothetical protein VNJ01_16000 [Bacteriovoracaceae bacterium]|nr:hypothetical protein [Bacteriovoracaceae bacterium]